MFLPDDVKFIPDVETGLTHPTVSLENAQLQEESIAFMLQQEYQMQLKHERLRAKFRNKRQARKRPPQAERTTD